jgi:hypothetical protein
VKRPAQKRAKQKSQYELYPSLFFNRKDRCTWDVKPTGNYTADCEMGLAYAIEFLKTCDKTNGWASLLQSITADMIRAGYTDRSAAGNRQVNRVSRESRHEKCFLFLTGE